MNRPGDFVPGLLLWEWRSPETVVSGLFGLGLFFCSLLRLCRRALGARGTLWIAAGGVVRFVPLPQRSCGTLGWWGSAAAALPRDAGVLEGRLCAPLWGRQPPYPCLRGILERIPLRTPRTFSALRAPPFSVTRLYAHYSAHITTCDANPWSHDATSLSFSHRVPVLSAMNTKYPSISCRTCSPKPSRNNVSSRR